MDNSPAEVIQNYLVAMGEFGDPTAPTPTWPLYESFLPDEAGVPDSAAAIYDTAGIKDARTMDGTVFQHFGIQIKVRAQLQGDAWSKVTAIADFIEALYQAAVTVNGHNYLIQNVSQAGPPLYLGLEPGTKRRSQYTLNFLVALQETNVMQSSGYPLSLGLVSGVAASLLTVALTPGQMKGGKILYFISATDGVKNVVMEGGLSWSAENAGGTLGGNVQAFSDVPAPFASSGSINVVGSLLTSVANQVSVQIKVTITGLGALTSFTVQYASVGAY